MNPGKVLADVVYASGDGQRYTPTVLTLNRTAFNRDDVVTSQIETLLYAFGGAFDVKPVDGLKVRDLVKSSPNSMLVDNVVATVSGDAATKGFVPGNKSRRSPAAVGKIQDRVPGRTAETERRPQGRQKPPRRRTKPCEGSAGENSVILVADIDMLNDGAAVDVQEVFGRRIVVPSTATSRSRKAWSSSLVLGRCARFAAQPRRAFRPLTVVREMEAKPRSSTSGA